MWQLFIATSKLNHFDLPDSFYNMSIEEIKKEQKLKLVDKYLQQICMQYFMMHRFSINNKLHTNDCTIDQQLWKKNQFYELKL